MRNSSSYSIMKGGRKGQFFILSAIAIATILFFVSRWLQPLEYIDTSSIVSQEEFFVFDNIREKSSAVVANSESCDDLAYNVQEYKSFVENSARSGSYVVAFDYRITPCSDELETGAVVEVFLKVASESADAKGTFSEVWMP